MRYVLGSRASIGGVLGQGRGGAAGLPIAGAVLWLDAAQITGLSDGAAITTWPDMSGNGYDATQTGASTLKPTYKTGIANGKPIARFDGGDSSRWFRGRYLSMRMCAKEKRAAIAHCHPLTQTIHHYRLRLH